MTRPADMLDPAAIAAALGSHSSRFAIDVLPVCDSTNARLLDAPLPDDTRLHVLACEEQTAGRGRRGRSWLSWPGAALTFSVLWRLPPGMAFPAGLSLVAGVALARALEKLGVEGVQLKWPNDVQIHGRKLAGILIELVPARGRLVAAVIGIGLNIRLPADADIPHEGGVIDLAACLDQLPSRNVVLAEVLSSLADMLDSFSAGGFSPLRAAWQQRNAHADLPVRLIGENETTCGVCRGVDEDGALLLETEAGLTRVLSGEVSLRNVP